jgi:hypothetical protein
LSHAHRWVLAVPFLVLLLTTLIGGQLNSVDARGRVVDDSTGLPVAGVSITYGQNRGTVSAEDGSYVIANLPRGARLKTTMPGYPPQTPSAEVTEIRLVPGSLSLQVNEEGTTDTRVPGVEVRQGDKLLTKCTAEPCGQLVIDLTSGLVGQKALVCAPAHESKEIELKGVTLIMTLQPKEGFACPPLPTPSPSPAPSPSPTAPPASPTPSASP